MSHRSNLRYGWAAIGLGVAIALGAFGCGSSERETASSTPAEASAGSYAASESPRSFAKTPMNGDEAPLHTAARSSGVRAVVRDASLTVEVENLERAEKDMKESVQSHGGYVANEQGDNLASEEPTLHLRIRIPEPSFEEVLTGFEALGRRTQKTISASDITEDILDNEATLKSLRQQMSVLKPTSDVPTYNPGFDSIKDRIRELESQRSQLAVRASMSSIDLTLQQKANARISSAAHSSWGSDTWNSAVTSALGAFRIAGAGLIWLLVYSPLWGAAAAVGMIALRAHRRSVSGPA